MNKIEEILCKKFGVENLEDLSEAIEYVQHRTYDVDKISEAMQEYAELYCEEFRQRLLKSGFHYENVHAVDFSTIETLELPEHE